MSADRSTPGFPTRLAPELAARLGVDGASTETPCARTDARAGDGRAAAGNHDPDRAGARTDARVPADELASRFRVAASTRAAGGQWPGRADLAAVVDELRGLLAVLSRARSVQVRNAGAEIAASAVVELRGLVDRAAAVDRRRRAQGSGELRAAIARRREQLGGGA